MGHELLCKCRISKWGLSLLKLADFPQGAFVSNIEEDSPAFNTTLKAGDVITSINGQSLANCTNNKICSNFAAAKMHAEIEFFSTRREVVDLVSDDDTDTAPAPPHHTRRGVNRSKPLFNSDTDKEEEKEEEEEIILITSSDDDGDDQQTHRHTAVSSQIVASSVDPLARR